MHLLGSTEAGGCALCIELYKVVTARDIEVYGKHISTSYSIISFSNISVGGKFPRRDEVFAMKLQ